jgi:hypothetical protein
VINKRLKKEWGAPWMVVFRWRGLISSIIISISISISSISSSMGQVSEKDVSFYKGYVYQEFQSLFIAGDEKHWLLAESYLSLRSLDYKVIKNNKPGEIFSSVTKWKM